MQDVWLLCCAQIPYEANVAALVLCEQLPPAAARRIKPAAGP